MEAGKKLFNHISQPDNCLHHIFPPQRDILLVIRLPHAKTYAMPLTKNKTISFLHQPCTNELCL